MGSNMGTMVETPFGPSILEVPLPQAPLVFVVAQARFERIASISSEEFIATFQEAIRPVYPVMRREQQAGVLIGSDGRVVTSDAGIVWRFEERPESWQVALAPDSVALSTTRYTSRDDFMSRLGSVLAAAHRTLSLRFCERLGVRYVDRVTDEDLLTRLPDLVRLEVVGSSAADLGEQGVEQVHSFSDATYRLADGSEMHARWGILPPQATLDPAIEAAGMRSWILDLDAYTREQERFDPTALSQRAGQLCERIYRFFRWAVRDDFLMAHGGQP
jgi:uncharacterized protein (TIGR04255 family)